MTKDYPLFNLNRRFIRVGRQNYWKLFWAGVWFSYEQIWIYLSEEATREAEFRSADEGDMSDLH